MDYESLIRLYASRGLSKRQVMGALGISYRKLMAICEYIPGLAWARKGQTLGDKEARSVQKGIRTPAQEAAWLKGNAARRNSAKKHTAFGVTGCMRDLAGMFGVVDRTTVAKRIRDGWTIEAALITKAQDPSCRKPGLDHPWRRLLNPAAAAEHPRWGHAARNETRP